MFGFFGAKVKGVTETQTESLMATRSFIAKKDGDNYTGIYCHWDGYPSHMLKMLENYKESSIVDELLSMGSASSINETLESSKFYHRDRNEKLQITKTFSLHSLMNTAKNSGCEYLYIFKDNEWHVSEF